MTDLSTTYLGLNLKNPLVASASPISKNIDKARKLEEAGVSAIVMYSLFEEQIIHESLELDHYLPARLIHLQRPCPTCRMAAYTRLVLKNI